MIIAIIILQVVFGASASVLAILFAAASLPKTEKKKYRTLKWIDTRKFHILFLAVVFGVLTAVVTGLKDIYTTRSEVVSSLEKVEPIVVADETNLTGVENQRVSNTNTEGFDIDKITSGSIVNSVNSTIRLNGRTEPQTLKNAQTRAPKQLSVAKAKQLVANGKYGEAIAECDRILAIDPKNNEAWSIKNWARKQVQILKQ